MKQSSHRKTFRIRLRKALHLSAFSLWLVACQAAALAPTAIPGSTMSAEATSTRPATGFAGVYALSTPIALLSNTATLQATEQTGRPEETPVVVSEPVVSASPVEATLPSQKEAASDPLHFVFPSPVPAPVSAWRPPLYPTPWAPTQFDHFFFARPIAADVVNWPLADYRYGGVFFGNEVHSGVDIPAPLDSPVLAAGPGKVTWAGYGLYAQKEDPNDPYGLAVAIRHDFGYQGEVLYTIYGHMDKILVMKGQHVEGGEQIGLVGQTGKVTGVHLHFEVRIGKDNFFGSRNPELWMSPPQGWGILAARIMGTSGALLDRQVVKVHSLDTNQYWEVKTYGHGPVNCDPYYQENMVIGDLPAGNYEIWIPYAGTIYDLDILIQPGLVSYFTFRGRNGYHTGLPPIPGADFTPPPPP